MTSEATTPTNSKYPFGDVPLEKAMIAWNEKTWNENANYHLGMPGDVMVVPWPDTHGWCDSLRLNNTTCACWNRWRTQGPAYRLNALFLEALRIVCLDGVAPSAMHAALLAIPEYRETINLRESFLG
jgi:hypothetical protein